MNQTIPSQAQRINATALRDLIWAIMQGPKDYYQLAEITGLSKTTVRRWLAPWRQDEKGMPKLVAITAWHEDARGYPTPHDGRTVVMEIAALLVLWVAAMAFVAHSPDEVVKMALLLCWGAIAISVVWNLVAGVAMLFQ